MIWVSLVLAILELILKLPELIDLFRRIFGKISGHSLFRQHALMLDLYELVLESKLAPDGLAAEEIKKPFEDFLQDIS